MELRAAPISSHSAPLPLSPLHFWPAQETDTEIIRVWWENFSCQLGLTQIFTLGRVWVVLVGGGVGGELRVAVEGSG